MSGPPAAAMLPLLVSQGGAKSSTWSQKLENLLFPGVVGLVKNINKEIVLFPTFLY